MKFLMFFIIVVFASVITFVNAQPPEQAPIVPISIFTPDSSVQLAAADLATIPENERYKIRYISLYNIPKAQRKEYASIVSFMVNSLGTRKKIHIPVFVGNSDETLIRLDIDKYEWKTEAWENLGSKGSGPKASPEPYFQFYTNKEMPGPVEKRQVVKKRQVIRGYYQGTNQPYYVEEEYTETEEVPGKPILKDTLIVAPWIDLESIEFLAKWTKSKTPIFRADWFITYVSIPGAYYEFLKLGNTVGDFENLIFANSELAKKAKSQDKAVIVTSNVARNNRTLNRSPTFTGGYYWQSHDSKSSVGDRQYTQNVLDEKFDATEDIGTLSNGLQAYFLTDGAGKRLDFADQDIAIDNSAVDRVVRTGRSCIICHASGILSLDDEIRALTKKLQDKEQVKLLVTKKEDFLRIEDLFDSNIDEQIIKDQNLYIAAVAKTNGLKADVNAKIYAKIWDNYYEKLMSKEQVALDLGVTLEELETYAKLSSDNVVLGLLKKPIRPVRRDQWERSFQGMMTIIMAQKKGLVNKIIIAPPVPIYVPVDK